MKVNIFNLRKEPAIDPFADSPENPKPDIDHGGRSGNSISFTGSARDVTDFYEKLSLEHAVLPVSLMESKIYHLSGIRRSVINNDIIYNEVEVKYVGESKYVVVLRLNESILQDELREIIEKGSSTDK